MVELSRLLVHGVIGTYTHFEATEVFMMMDGQKQATNVFTILVAEDRERDTLECTPYLGDRMRLTGLPGRFFGIRRYIRPIAELVPALDAMVASKVWSGSGAGLEVGPIEAAPNHFVPPDSLEPVPLNRLLKNNFWNGSHVFEWSDTKKDAHRHFFDNPPLLQKLAEKVQQHVPLSLAAMSDRLGNFVVQLPVTAFVSEFQQIRKSGDFIVEISWRPTVTPRDLRATCGRELDGSIDGYASEVIPAQQSVTLPMKAGLGSHKGIVWDEANKLVLACTGVSAFFNAIGFQTNLVDTEPRIFSIPNDNATPASHTVYLRQRGKSNVVGDNRSDYTGGYTGQRLYKEHVDRVASERIFVQYKPYSDNQADERARALSDIRRLMNMHGDEGVWLWDPYLSARDILETLFHCPYFGVELRALTNAREPPERPAPSGVCTLLSRLLSMKQKSNREPNFIGRQRAVFDSVTSNWRGLQLEYRARVGPAGFGFHDRFLIFPRSDGGALAWSLGTSVNSLGTEHHILQRVDDGELVKGAFTELWDQLVDPSYVVWRKQ